jgi:septal ring factor EnvC (AmiA/AmiB activator)
MPSGEQPDASPVVPLAPEAMIELRRAYSQPWAGDPEGKLIRQLFATLDVVLAESALWKTAYEDTHRDWEESHRLVRATEKQRDTLLAESAHARAEVENLRQEIREMEAMLAQYQARTS